MRWNASQRDWGFPRRGLKNSLRKNLRQQTTPCSGAYQNLPANKTRQASRLGNEQERLREGMAVPRKPRKPTRFYYADCFSARSTSFKQRSARSRSAPSALTARLGKLPGAANTKLAAGLAPAAAPSEVSLLAGRDSNPAASAPSRRAARPAL